MSWRDVLTTYSVEWLIGLSVVQFAIFVLLVLTWRQFRIIRKTQKQLLRGVSAENLEQLVSRFTQTVETLERQLDEAAIEIDSLKRQMANMKGHVGLVRYNALQETSSDLSFSFALLDREQNGVVISSLYGRHQSYVYAKPIVKGKSDYSLSNEEKKAIAEAMSIYEYEKV